MISARADPPGLDGLLAEAWEEAGRDGPLPPGWRPFDAARTAGFAIVERGEIAGYAAVRPSPCMDSVDFLYVRRAHRRPGVLRALIDRAVAHLADHGLADVIYVGYGWWRGEFPASLARGFSAAGFGRFEGVYLGRDLDRVPPVPAPPPDYVCREWEDRFHGPVIDLMEATPEPGAIYWGRDLCERSVGGAAHPLRPMFPGGTGQLVFHVPEGGAGDGLLCAFTLATDTGYVNHVYTRDGHRGRGLASAAVVRLLHALRTRGHDRTTILTHDTNPGALALYKRLGFEELFRYPQFHRPRRRP